MRYVQLRAFHYVAICGGFSSAANELLLSQPAISDQVRRLEEEYDLLLFKRQHKQVILTPMGERLLAITHRMFETETQALELLSESRALRSGQIIVMADAVYHILPVLAAFRERYPGISVVLRSGNTETITHALMNYEADLGVIGDISPLRTVEAILLRSSRIIACVSTSHPLAAQARVTLRQLLDYPLVGREKGSKTRKKTEEAAKTAGLDLTFAIEAEGREAMREIVAMGLGVGFVSEAELGQDPRLIALPIADPLLTMDEVILCLKERLHTKMIRAFFEIARAYASPSI